MERIRPPAVAGSFYPGSSEELQTTVDDLFRDASSDPAVPAITGTPKAIIAPHAGYIYSGPTAARAFQALVSPANSIRRIVLLGPAHRVPILGVALPGADSFATPLGLVEIDAEAAVEVASLPQVLASPEAHAQEHSLEVELPFLQRRLEGVRILPLVVGRAEPREVAEILERVWGGPETRIVISSDLSHYLSYEMARQVDANTAEAILALEGPLTHEQACGATPINGLLLAARRHHLQPQLLDLRNSGDTAGDRGQVVGYGAFAFVEPHDG